MIFLWAILLQRFSQKGKPICFTPKRNPDYACIYLYVKIYKSLWISPIVGPQASGSFFQAGEYCSWVLLLVPYSFPALVPQKLHPQWITQAATDDSTEHEASMVSLLKSPKISQMTEFKDFK